MIPGIAGANPQGKGPAIVADSALVMGAYVENGMEIQTLLDKNHLILIEAAVIEILKRTGQAALDPDLQNALLMYDTAGKAAMDQLYQRYISVGIEAGVPILICSPTWRANRERVAAAGVAMDVNADAVRYVKGLRDENAARSGRILIGGLLGPKNDAYDPAQGLPADEAEAFHGWQAQRLAEAGPDLLLAATVPCLPEAEGLARAMGRTDLPYIISFVINRRGKILDGTALDEAFRHIDAVCETPPLGYMVNCAYPSFLNASQQPEATFARLIGYQANGSSLDHADLDGSGEMRSDDIADWGNRMISLNREYGVQILGGCCGTDERHLKYLVLQSRAASTNGSFHGFGL